MSALKIAAIALIAAGILELVYGGFSYTKETHEAKIGSLELSVKDKETVNIPITSTTPLMFPRHRRREARRDRRS